MTHATDDHKRLPQARQTRPHQAKPRRLQKEREHLQREQARAPRPLPALEPALEELGLPDTIVEEVQWTLRPQATRLGHIFGRMVPTCFGCRTPSELTRGRVWAKHLPGQVLGAWPTRQGVTPWQRWGQDVLETWWRPGEDTSPATRRRWPWTWGSDDRVCKTYGPRLGRGGTWWSGQEHRVRQGIDGVRRVLGSGTGTRVMPVDFTIRRPDPVGPGRPCHDQRTWLQVMVERPGVARQRRRLSLPAPRSVAASWVGAATWMAPVALPQHGTWLVEGTSRDGFPRPDGRRVTGPDLRTWSHGPWRDCLWRPGLR